MSFRVIALHDGEEMTSSSLHSKDYALGFARDLQQIGMEILRIVGYDGAVVADAGEIRGWFADARTACRREADAPPPEPAAPDWMP
jgi:hypothetical protein